MGRVREEFEKWASGLPYSLHRVGDEYKYMPTQHAWLGWKASRSAVRVQLPTAWSAEQSEYKSALIDELDEEGVSSNDSVG